MSRSLIWVCMDGFIILEGSWSTSMGYKAAVAEIHSHLINVLKILSSNRVRRAERQIANVPRKYEYLQILQANDIDAEAVRKFRGRAWRNSWRREEQSLNRLPGVRHILHSEMKSLLRAWMHLGWTVTHWKCVLKPDTHCSSYFFWKEKIIMCVRSKRKRIIQTSGSVRVKD